MSNDSLTLASMKLATNGSNWVTYRDQLIRTFESRGWRDHLTSTTYPTTYLTTGTVNGQSPKQRGAVEEAITKNWIAATVPDPIWNQIKSKTTTKEVWEAMKAIHQPISKKTTVDLHNELQTMKLEEEGNAVCSEPDWKDTPATPEQVIRLVIDEYDHRVNELDNSGPEEANATKSQKKRDRRRRNKGKKCHKPDQLKENCQADRIDEKRRCPLELSENDANEDVLCRAINDFGFHINDTANQNPNPRGRSKKNHRKRNRRNKANMANTDLKADTLDIEHSTTAEEIDNDGPNALQAVRITVPETHQSELQVELHGSKASISFANNTIDFPASNELKLVIKLTTRPTSALSESESIPVETDLYDTGTTHHMSPFRHRFTNYRTITPRPITAANGQTFYATGTGDLKIDAPNGDTTTPMFLHDALHAPDMAHTTISISRLTSTGNTVTFKDKACEIENKSGEVIARIPVSHSGLYKVERARTAANSNSIEKSHVHTCTNDIRPCSTRPNAPPDTPHVLGRISVARPRDLSRLRGSVVF